MGVPGVIGDGGADREQVVEEGAGGCHGVLSVVAVDGCTNRDRGPREGNAPGHGLPDAAVAVGRPLQRAAAQDHNASEHEGHGATAVYAQIDAVSFSATDRRHLGGTLGKASSPRRLTQGDSLRSAFVAVHRCTPSGRAQLPGRTIRPCERAPVPGLSRSPLTVERARLAHAAHGALRPPRRSAQLVVCRLSELAGPRSGAHSWCVGGRDGRHRTSRALPCASPTLRSTRWPPRVPGFHPTVRKGSHCKAIRWPWR